jgi:hypothetical protein
MLADLAVLIVIVNYYSTLYQITLILPSMKNIYLAISGQIYYHLS